MYEVCKTWLKAHAPILLAIALEERIGAAKESADRIEESAERSGQLIDEAERLTRDCQQIITTIYRRGEKSTETP